MRAEIDFTDLKAVAKFLAENKEIPHQLASHCLKLSVQELFLLIDEIGILNVADFVKNIQLDRKLPVKLLKNLLSKLFKAHPDLYASIVSQQNLIHLIDYQFIVMKLLVDKRVQAVEKLALDHSLLLELVTNHVTLVLERPVLPARDQIICKSAYKVFKNLNIDNPIVGKLETIQILETTFWSCKQLINTISSSGNVRFSNKDIAMSHYAIVLYHFGKIKNEKPWAIQTLFGFMSKHSSISYFVWLFSKTHDLNYSPQVPVFPKVDPPKVEYYNRNVDIKFIDNIDQVDEFLETTKSLNLIGIDCEWTDDLSIVQVAISTTAVYIFDVKTLGNNIALYLDDLFSRATVLTFCGKDDLRLLNLKTVNNPNNVFDLSSIIGIYSKKRGLTDLSFACLGVHLDKRPRMGYWDERPLNPTMQLYAAYDATILVDLYNYHAERHPKQ